VKILFLCHRIPFPPNKGDKLRAFNQIKEFSKKHSITLLTFVDDPADEKYTVELEKYCEKVIAVRRFPLWSALKSLPYMFSGKPLTLPYFYEKEMEKFIDGALASEGFDIIFVFSSSMAQYVETSSLPKLVDLVDADSEKWIQYSEHAPFPKSLVYRHEGFRLRNYEKKLSKCFDVSTVVSKDEKEKLLKFIEDDKWVRVIRNGINHTFYDEEHIDEAEEFLAGDLSKNILFVGGMFYFAYIDGVLNFYNKSFAAVKEKVSNVKFFIVGADPAPSIKKLNEDENVCVTGFVKDVRPFLKKTSVYVVPLRIAPGLQNKILEAMIMKIPVVSTSEAILGIDATDGVDVFVEDNPEKFGERVVELLQNEELCKKIGANARKMVLEKHNWKKNLREYERIFEELTSG